MKRLHLVVAVASVMSSCPSPVATKAFCSLRPAARRADQGWSHDAATRLLFLRLAADPTGGPNFDPISSTQSLPTAEVCTLTAIPRRGRRLRHRQPRPAVLVFGPRRCR